MEAIEEIKNVLGEKGMVGGPAAVSHDLQYTTAKEVKYYSLLAFVIVSIILFLSLESFIEPILFFYHYRSSNYIKYGGDKYNI